MYVSLPEHVILKARYGEWYFIDTQHRNRERLLIESDTVELVHTILRGASIFDVATHYDLPINEVVAFVDALRAEGVMILCDAPVDASGRCFAFEPPLDSINILITNACNLTCAHCYVQSGKRLRGELTGTEWVTVLEQARCLGAFELNVSGGEPLLHRNFWDIAEYIATVPTFNANLNTNGTQQIEGHENVLARAFKSVQISLDDVIPERHDAFRGKHGSFVKAVRTIEHLVKVGVETNVAFTLTPQNIGVLNDVIEFCERIGVSALNIGLLAGIGRARANYLLQVTPRSSSTSAFFRAVYHALRDLAVRQTSLRLLFPFRIREAERETLTEKRFICSGDTTQIVYVLADGTISPCDKMPSEAFGYGNIRENSLADVWNSERMRAFKLMSPRELPKCRACPHLQVCGGACIARAYQDGGSIESPDWASCAIAQQLAADHQA